MKRKNIACGPTPELLPRLLYILKIHFFGVLDQRLSCLAFALCTARYFLALWGHSLKENQLPSVV